MLARSLLQSDPEPDDTYGLPGHVYGNHRHQKPGEKVPTNDPEWEYDVEIRWPNKRELEGRPSRTQPLIMRHGTHWGMFKTNLEEVERKLAFSARDHCRKLCAETVGRKALIMDWGCGTGAALKELSMDPEIQDNALLYGYSSVWDVRWNDVEGVQFLFFVKEHLLEYFRRTRQQIDFVFTHGAMDYLKDDELPSYLEALGELMPPGAKVVFQTSVIRRDILWELEHFSPPDGDPKTSEKGTPCVLTRR